MPFKLHAGMWVLVLAVWGVMPSSARIRAETQTAPVSADMEKEWNRQYAALMQDLRARDAIKTRADETYHPESLIEEADRDPCEVVLRRAAALLQDLKKTAADAKFAVFEKDLAELRAAASSTDVKNAEARRLLYTRACRLRRQIAFANPLLDFDKILFIKRHRALYDHMCDQYYGMAATPGGGIYALSNPFGADVLRISSFRGSSPIITAWPVWAFAPLPD